MGNRPKPTALKRLQGNPGKRPLNKREPRFRHGRPYCPSHLAPAAKREWRRIVNELYRVGLLTLVDRAALAAYCQLYARWAQAEKELVKSGLTIVTTNGNVIQNPLVGIANTALDGMRKFLIEFGMTPSSRAKLAVPGQDEEKTLEEQISDLLSGVQPLEEKECAY